MKTEKGKQTMKNMRHRFLGRLTVSAVLILISAFAVFAQSENGGQKKASLEDQIALVSEFEVNGLKVLVKRRPNMETVSAGLFVRGGVRNLTPQTAGIENFMLEVASKGSVKYPREILRRETSKIGGGIGAGSNNDFSVLSLASTRKDFDKLWDVFTDVALNPAFAPEDIELVRTQILTGLSEQETNNDGFLGVLQDRIIYSNHPYSIDVSGKAESVSKFKAADLRAYHKKLMETSRLLLVVVGDIGVDELKKKVAATLGTLPRGNYKEQAYPALDFSKPTVDVTERSLPTNYIRGVFSAPSLNDPDYYAMSIAISVLHNLVYQEVRLKRQLSYAPSAEMASLGANTANIYVTSENANESIEVMLDQVQLLRTSLLYKEFISSVAGSFLTQYYINQETNAEQVRELAKYELVGGGWRNAFTFLDKVKEVTPEQVRAASQKYMKNIRFIVIGNPASVNKDVFLRKFGE